VWTAAILAGGVLVHGARGRVPEWEQAWTVLLRLCKGWQVAAAYTAVRHTPLDVVQHVLSHPCAHWHFTTNRVAWDRLLWESACRRLPDCVLCAVVEATETVDNDWVLPWCALEVAVRRHRTDIVQSFLQHPRCPRPQEACLTVTLAAVLGSARGNPAECLAMLRILWHAGLPSRPGDRVHSVYQVPRTHPELLLAAIDAADPEVVFWLLDQQHLPLRPAAHKDILLRAILRGTQALVTGLVARNGLPDDDGLYTATAAETGNLEVNGQVANAVGQPGRRCSGIWWSRRTRVGTTAYSGFPC
jgi:hypothetical protein